MSMSLLHTVNQWAEAHALDLEGVMLECRVVPVWKQTKVTVSGAICDEYEAAIDQVKFLRAGELVAQLSSEGRWPERMTFESLVKTIKDDVSIPYLFHPLIEKGGEAPTVSQPYRLSWHRLTELVQAEDEFLEGLINNDDELLNRGNFRRFKQSAVYKSHPCSEAFFTELHTEQKDSRHLATSAAEYYAWFVRSATRITDEGALTAEAKVELHRVLTTWANLSEERQCSGIYRNLEVHPRHRPAYGAEIGAFRSATSSVAPVELAPAARQRRPG